MQDVEANVETKDASIYSGSASRPEIDRFVLDLVEGPVSGLRWMSAESCSSIGSHPSSDLVIRDRSVSRFHCEIMLTPRGVRLRDLGSRNGTLVDGVDAVEVFLRTGSTFRMGDTTAVFRHAEERVGIEVSGAQRFGNLVGQSVAMRRVFSLLERAAASDATVLLEGETGTGKDAAAESMHQAGSRKELPFIVVDCGSMPATLIQSELFGHERGSFTGAAAQHIGVFEAASGGTVFLDEIGELDLDLQPKLLRVIEDRTVQRLGGTKRIPVDVRIIAGTNRDLRRMVNDGSFRSDLYYRLAVLRVRMPSLRERPEDISLLAQSILADLAPNYSAVSQFNNPEFFATLRTSAWPGNVRELRNYLENCLVLERPAELGVQAEPAEPADFKQAPSYGVAKQQVIDAFERRYLRWVLDQNDGNVSHAARTAGIHRRNLQRLIRRYGL